MSAQDKEAVKTAKHQPVLLQETIEALTIEPGNLYVDATFGRGGHTREILNHGGKVIAFDHDQEAIEYGTAEFEKELTTNYLLLIRESFIKLEQELKTRGIEQVDGVLFDFGTSVDQLTSQDRGFSFESDSPLDMRMDDRLGVTASDLLAILPEKQLAQLFIEYGGEEQSRAIAKRIVKVREKTPITSTRQLAQLVFEVKGGRFGHLNPATKVFQALRIAVNTELDNIEQGLPPALNVVKSGGRIVTIAFHEGEDRIAKQLFKNWEEHGKGENLTKRPIQPSEVEMKDNPRSRSAKLRIFKKH